MDTPPPAPPAPAVVAASPPVGTRDNPIPLGTAAALGDGWTLRVDEVTADATEQVLAAQYFYPLPPSPGHQFFLARITAIADDGGVHSPYQSPSPVTTRAIGARGAVYSTWGEGSGCGATIPHAFPDASWLPPGPVTGNICWAIPSAEANSLTMFYKGSVNRPAPMPHLYFSLRPAGASLFEDDFARPDSGWPCCLPAGADLRAGYEDGEYAVAKLARSGGAPFATHPRVLSDFLVEIDARLLPPADNAYLYLLFRRQANGDAYAFVVDPNNHAFLLRRQLGSSGTVLIGWTTAPVMRAGTSPNRLGVRAQGADIELLVNGEVVGHAHDASLQAGTLGLGVGHRQDGAAEARFSQLLVTDGH